MLIEAVVTLSLSKRDGLSRCTLVSRPHPSTGSGCLSSYPNENGPRGGGRFGLQSQSSSLKLVGSFFLLLVLLFPRLFRLFSVLAQLIDG